jgi:hypothetical protein
VRSDGVAEQKKRILLPLGTTAAQLEEVLMLLITKSACELELEVEDSWTAGTCDEKKRDVAVAVSALARYARRRLAVVCGLADELITQHQAGALARRKRNMDKPTAGRLGNQHERKRQRLGPDNGPARGS